MKFSLVIPCYNEAASLPQLLERCKNIAALPAFEVIIVDNGSTDGTSMVLQKLMPKYPGCRSVHIEVNKGYGLGILCGLKAAKGEVLAWSHADLQTDPQDIFAGIELFERYGYNIFVKGRRYGRPYMDVFFTVGMSLFETILLTRPMWDINAQPTMFPRSFFESWTDPPEDFSLDLYAYFLAKRCGMKVYRFPVKFNIRAYGVSHWNVNWTAKMKFIRRTVNFSLQLRKKV